MKQTEILFLVDIYKNTPNYHGWLFLHSNDFFFPLPLEGFTLCFWVYKRKNLLVWAEFRCPLKIFWSSCLHLPHHAATLALLTEEAVVETEPAVLLLSSVTDYYLRSIIHTMIKHAVIISSLASKLALVYWTQCAMGYLVMFQFSEQATMLQRALAFSNEVSKIFYSLPCLTLSFVVPSLLTWRLGGKERH